MLADSCRLHRPDSEATCSGSRCKTTKQHVRDESKAAGDGLGPGIGTRSNVGILMDASAEGSSEGNTERHRREGREERVPRQHLNYAQRAGAKGCGLLEDADDLGESSAHYKRQQDTSVRAAGLGLGELLARADVGAGDQCVMLSDALHGGSVAGRRRRRALVGAGDVDVRR